jgi:hypothetical protein
VYTQGVVRGAHKHTCIPPEGTYVFPCETDEDVTLERAVRRDRTVERGRLKTVPT